MSYPDAIRQAQYACLTVQAANAQTATIVQVCQHILSHLYNNTPFEQIDVSAFADGQAVREKIGQIIRLATSLQG